MWRAGFTMLELLVVAAVAGIATVYMLESVTAGNRAYTVIDQVAESQQNLRAIADLMERDVRHTAMMVPIGGSLCAIDNTTSPDILFVTDSEAIDPDGDIAPYDGAMVQGSVANVTGPSMTITLDSLILEPPSPSRPAYDTNGDGNPDSDFRGGSGVIVTDVNNPGRGAACGIVETVNLVTPSITFALVSPVLPNTAATVQLVAIPAHVYQIANGDELRRNGMLLAKGVEDIQFSYFIDADDDGIVDAGERWGTTAGVDDFAAQGRDMGFLREIRMNLVVRTRAEDRDFEGRLQTRENRAAAATDGFRRRVYTTTIMPRNMVGRS